MRIDELSRKFTKSIRAYDVYSQQLKLLIDRRDALRKKVGQAKYRIKLKPEITEVLDDLRTRSHQRVLGTIENLLTAALVDVMGDENCKVSLSLDTSRGLPDLQFGIYREYNGRRVEEDILHANGLSYSNVLSTALRVIAMESGHMRRFLLLDESDKNIAPDNIQYYTAMIKNLSNDFHTQILMISHHSAENFTGCNVSRIKQIRPTPDHVAQVAIDIQNPYPEWADKDIGIRSLHMVNFESHADTRLFLSPRVSVLQGPNGIGKSSVHRALYALSGQSSDGVIRHFQDEAIVEAEVANGYVVQFSRHRKRNPKVLFSLFHKSDMTNPIKQESLPKGTPDWVFDLLGLRQLNGIEVQLCWQGEPFFLLDKTGSKAAELLSLGKESSYIKDMEAAYKGWVSQDRHTIKHGESVLGQLDYQIDLIQSTLSTLRFLPDMEQTLSSLRNTEKDMDHLSKLMRYMPHYKGIGDDLDVDFLSHDVLAHYHIETRYASIQRASELVNGVRAYQFVRTAIVHDVEDHVIRLDKLQASYFHADYIGRMLCTYAFVAEPHVDNVDTAFFDSTVAADISVRHKILGLLNAYTGVSQYTIPDYQWTIGDPPANVGLMTELNQQFQDMVKTEKEADNARKAENLAESQWLAWVSAHGGVCPACDQPFNVTHHTHSIT